MRKLPLVLIGVGLTSLTLGGGTATAIPPAKPAIAADDGVTTAYYRGWGYYGGSYAYYPRYFGGGYYGGYGYYPRYYGGGSYGYYPRYYGGGYYGGYGYYPRYYGGGSYGYNRRRSPL